MYPKMEDYNNDPDILIKFGRMITEDVKKGKVTQLLVEMKKLEEW